MAPMTRRRSARIASASKMPARGTPHKSLAPVSERDEHVAMTNSPAAPRTPAGSSPRVPSNSEMNPSKSHNSLLPPSSAVRLGFVDIPSVRQDSVRKSARPDRYVAESAEETAAMLQQTPSKSATAPPSSSFTFRFTRTGEPKTADMGLSKEALHLMEELREETLKIRADMEVERAEETAKEEAEGHQFDANGRRIAKPKSRAGRFSDVHSAEFQKMDSIENHPSAFRAVPGRFTPVKTPTAPTTALSSAKRGLKRTQSKANLDETPKQAGSSVMAPSTGKKVQTAPAAASAANEERKVTASAQKDRAFHSNMPVPSAKRVKQSVHDDASSSRPISRDGSALPRPTTTAPLTAFASVPTPAPATSLPRPQIPSGLMTPTRSLLSRSTSIKTPGTAKTASKFLFASGMKKSATTSSLQAPGGFDLAKVKPASTVRLVEDETGSENKRPVVTANTVAKRRALPMPAMPTLPFSKTPAPPRVAKPVLKYAVTTPSRKLTKHVAFTPTTQRAVVAEKSPSLFRSFMPRTGLKPSEEGAAGMDDQSTASTPAKESPSVRRFGAVLYPDLSKHPLLLGLDGNAEAPSTDAATETDKVTAAATAGPPEAQASVPGTFTFRSDKTICFGEKPPAGFGASPGQASVRQVRLSTATGTTHRVPGSFPGGGASSAFSGVVATAGPNKENSRPMALNNIPHGIANKKRHRVSEAEDTAEEEEAERTAKRRKNERVPEGEALMAPRLMGKSGSGSVRGTPQKKAQPTGSFAAALAKTPMSAAKTLSMASAKTPMSSTKKRPVLTMSRLNSLARPKLRK
ncbi:hypothetical protein CMQ_7456 [Grosmannia clavigera kw1407]|uniref:Erythromycin esterase n=1 Tax=Grosmannia clavigera (strain kw1407 / UAMH 11150) TaxID=655863 RepID=F0XQA7_GROCL|nr:uncharacterized protein CMQ_7456 [Grosmannia clavigera kw1407]EFX00454.1 hypothetical protein CMQ_7456 [Grosmannia clavigera kw1407]